MSKSLLNKFTNESSQSNHLRRIIAPVTNLSHHKTAFFILGQNRIGGIK